MDTEERILMLLDKYTANLCMDEELDELFGYLVSGQYNDIMDEHVLNSLRSRTPVADGTGLEAYASESIVRKILSGPMKSSALIRKVAVKRAINRYASLTAAMIIAALIWIGLIRAGYNLFTTPKKGKYSSGYAAGNRLSPKGVTLTLADGKTVSLDSAGKGLIITQGGTRVFVDKRGVMYKAGGGNNLMNIAYNTMTTGPGKQYHLLLPDGSQVWLNASSSVRFPVAFTEKERTVEISGEVCFEIKPNAFKPFKVLIGKDIEVGVLGTEFNVNAYNDEGGIRTTLLSGSIKVSCGSQSRQLLPGEQAQIVASEADAAPIIRVEAVDTSESVAWRNGLFTFRHSTIGVVMKEISRWYDVGVVMKDEPVSDHFHATLSRDLRLEDVLRSLEMTGSVKFYLEDNKVIVSAH